MKPTVRTRLEKLEAATRPPSTTTAEPVRIQVVFRGTDGTEELGPLFVIPALSVRR